MPKLVIKGSHPETAEAPVLNGIGKTFPMLSAAVRELIRCPRCGGALIDKGGRLRCANARCGMLFPIVDGIPVLINDQTSLFARGDFVSRRNTTFNLSRGQFVRRVDCLLPSLSRNVTTKRNYQAFAELLLRQSANPLVLVVGGSILGRGMD